MTKVAAIVPTPTASAKAWLRLLLLWTLPSLQFQIALAQTPTQQEYWDDDTAIAAAAPSMTPVVVPGAIDLRNLLLPPEEAVAVGGSGLQPYGDLFSKQIWPEIEDLQYNASDLTDPYDNVINNDVIRPVTFDQSGINGTFYFPETTTLFEYNATANTNSDKPSVRLECFVSDFLLQAVDTVLPLEIIQPTDAHVLSNTFQLGRGQTQPLYMSVKVSVEAETSGSDSLGPSYAPLLAVLVPDQYRYEQLQVDLVMPTSFWDVDWWVLMDESKLVDFPISMELFNPTCWVDTLMITPEYPPLALYYFAANLTTWDLNVSCIECTAPLGSFLGRYQEAIRPPLEEYYLVLTDRIESLVDAGVTTVVDLLNLTAMVDQVARLCPHHPEWNETIAANVATAVNNNDWEIVWKNETEMPPLMLDRETVETVLSMLAVGLPSGLAAVAQLYVPLPFPEPLEAPPLDQGNRNYLDWNNLPSPLDRLGEAAREILNSTTREDIQRLLRDDNLVNDDGWMVVPLENITLEGVGVELSFKEIRVEGLDSIITDTIEVLVPTGSYELYTMVEFQYLSMEVPIGVRHNGQREEFMTLSLQVQNISLEFDMLLALDADVIGAMELGVILSMDPAIILPCLLAATHEFMLSALKVTTAYVGPLNVVDAAGFLPDDLQDMVNAVSDSILVMFENDIVAMVPKIFGATVRDLINEQFTHLQQSMGDISSCDVDANSLASNGLVNLQGLLLGSDPSSPYGTLFAIAYSYLQENLFTESGVSLLNDFLASWTEELSTIPGVLTFPSIGVNESTQTYLGSMNATFEYHISGFSLQNVDSLGTPFSLFYPSSAHVLDNNMSLGVSLSNQSKPLVLGADAFFAATDAESVPVWNVLSGKLAFEDLVTFTSGFLSVSEKSLMTFPIKDLMNPNCWIATIPSTLDLGPDLPFVSPVQLQQFLVQLASMDTSVACEDCVPGVESYLERYKRALIPPDGDDYNTVVTQRVELFVEDIVPVVVGFVNVTAMIHQAEQLCPHNQHYGPQSAIKSSTNMSLIWNDMNGTSIILDPTTAETFLAVGLVGIPTGLSGTSQLFLPLPMPEPLIAPIPSTNQSWLDWMDLPPTLASLADAALGFLAEPDQANQVMKDYLLDENGWLVLSLEDMNLQWEGPGIAIAVNELWVGGLDTLIDATKVLKPVGSHELESVLHWEYLSFKVPLHILLDGQVQEATILSFQLTDVILHLQYVLAMDAEQLGAVELGAVLSMDTAIILPCLFSAIDAFHISMMNVTAQTIAPFEVLGDSGFLPADLQDVVNTLCGSITGEFESDILAMLPKLFGSTVRDMINSQFEQYETHAQHVGNATACAVDASSYTKNSLVDFQKLLLKTDPASPYGTLLSTVYAYVQKNFFTDTGVAQINDFLSSWTEEQSSVQGLLIFPQMSFNNSLQISVGNMNAKFEYDVGGIVIENIDSLGTPFSLFYPPSAHVLDSHVSFGAPVGNGSRPLTFGADVFFGATDGEEMQIHNAFSIRLALDNITLFMSILLEMLEEAFLTFPVKDLANPYCWVATIAPSTASNNSELPGLAVVESSLRADNITTDLSCSSCTSPDLPDFLSALFDVVDTFSQVIENVVNGPASADGLDQFIGYSAARCPHSQHYDPDAPLGIAALRETFFGETDGSEDGARNERASIFHVLFGIFSGMVLLFSMAGYFCIRHRNRSWKSSLSAEGAALLRQQLDREEEERKFVDKSTTSLFRSPQIPANISFMVPVVIALNITLFLVAHLAITVSVSLDANFAGDEFTIHNLFQFRFYESFMNTYNNGGVEMAIMLVVFSGIWPYFKCLLSLFLWFVPPRILSARYRGALLLWIDAMNKLTVQDIFTTLLVIAGIFLFLGGPQLSGAASDFYAMRVVIVPGLALYCSASAQRISRVSSRWFLDYHNNVMDSAQKAYERDQLTKSINSISEAFADSMRASHLASGDLRVSERSRSSSLVLLAKELSDRGVGNMNPHGRSLVRFAEELSERDVGTTDEVETDDETDDDESISVAAPRRRYVRVYGWKILIGDLGVALVAITVLILVIVGLALAPAVSVDLSSILELFLESGTTYVQAINEYGVYSIILQILLTARLVLESTVHYAALGLLLCVIVLLISAMFIIGIVRWCREIYANGWREVFPLFKPNDDNLVELPSYLRLHAYKYFSIYIVSVIIGWFQLGSVVLYAVHMYCGILNSAYELLAFVGIVDSTSGSCWEAQMSNSHNLVVFFGSVFIMFCNLNIQLSRQYKTNVRNASDMLRRHHQESAALQHLTQVWQKDILQRKESEELRDEEASLKTSKTSTTAKSEGTPRTTQTGDSDRSSPAKTVGSNEINTVASLQEVEPEELSGVCSKSQKYITEDNDIDALTTSSSVGVDSVARGDKSFDMDNAEEVFAHDSDVEC